MYQQHFVASKKIKKSHNVEMNNRGILLNLFIISTHVLPSRYQVDAPGNERHRCVDYLYIKLRS